MVDRAISLKKKEGKKRVVNKFFRNETAADDSCCINNKLCKHSLAVHGALRRNEAVCWLSKGYH